MTKKTFTPDAHHQFRLYDGVTETGAIRITDLADYTPHRRTAIILPGTRVNHEIPQPIINGMFVPNYRSMINHALERQGLEKFAHIYCGVYGHNDEQMISDHYSHPMRKQADPNTRPFTTAAAGTDVRSFVRNVLLPFSGIEKNNQPTPEAMAERLSHLTLVAHSYGGTFAAEVAREFQFVLRTEYGFSREDALRTASEVVVVGIAPVRDMSHERLGFRNIDFMGRTDASNMGFMLRVAADHIASGLVPEDTTVETLANYYYHRSGYQHLPNTLLPPPTTELEEPQTSGNSYSQVIRAAMPPAIHWRTKADKPRAINQERLDDEHRNLAAAVRFARGLPEGAMIPALNGEELIQYGLVPTHDHRMYLQPADENHWLRRVFEEALVAAMTRQPQPPHLDPSASLIALLESPDAPGTIVNTEELARAAHSERTRPR